MLGARLVQQEHGVYGCVSAGSPGSEVLDMLEFSSLVEELTGVAPREGYVPGNGTQEL